MHGRNGVCCVYGIVFVGAVMAFVCGCCVHGRTCGCCVHDMSFCGCCVHGMSFCPWCVNGRNGGCCVWCCVSVLCVLYCLRSWCVYGIVFVDALCAWYDW